MRPTTPQEKKRLSYARDRRNAYGESSGASRKSIPLRKKKGRRAYRKATNQLLPKGLAASALRDDTSIEAKINSVTRNPWRKWPDVPLGTCVKDKLFKRTARFIWKPEGRLPENPASNSWKRSLCEVGRSSGGHPRAGRQ